MYAVFGTQELAVLSYWSSLSGSERITLAEQPVIEGKPALQYVGAELDTLKMELRWHEAFCQPEVELARLRKLMASRAAYPLVMANGAFRGRYVVTSIETDLVRTRSDGQIQIITAQVELKEYVAPPKPVAVKNPPAIAKTRSPAARKPATKVVTDTNADGFESRRIVRSGT